MRDTLRRGRMTVGEAVGHYLQRLEGIVRLKPRTKQYYLECAKVLMKPWPELARKDVRRVTKADYEEWVVRCAGNSSASVYNHTIALLRADSRKRG